jgi:DNA-binding transcriptional regulator YdaS (Cro superfamily)
MLAMTQMTPQQALEKAVQLADGQSALAAKLGKKQGHVWHWLNKSGQCPAEMAIPISQAVEGKITPGQLRPDIYPASTPEAAQ